MALAASAPPGPPGGRRHRQLRAAVVVVAACLAACLPLPAAAAAPKANSIPSTNAIAFLRQFGYLEGSRPPGWDGAVDVGDRFGTTNATTMGRPDSETLYTEEAVVTAIKLVQKFGAIPQTGVIDEATDKLMKARRCGCPDVVRHAPDVRGHTHRHKRFVVASKGWKRRHIKYYIANWTPKIGEDGVHALMVRAFDAWSAYGRLRFTRAAQPSEADITIAFGRGNHGDWFPFDGPGGILAHAFYPYEMATYGGDIHFDDDEQWAADPNATQLYDGAVDLFLVAVHEMGHSLGLGHSPDPQSIMFPYYQSKSESFKLGQDDIMGMYELYIKRQLEEDNDTPTYEENHRPAPPPNTTPRPPRTTTTRTTTTRTTTTRTTTPRRPRPPPRPRPTTTTTTTPRPRRPPTPPPSRPPPHRPPPPTSAPTYHGDDETVEEHKKHDHKHGIPPGPAGPFGPSDAGPGGGSDNGGGHSHGHGGGHGGNHGGSGHSGSGHSGSGHGGSGHSDSSHSGSGHGGSGHSDSGHSGSGHGGGHSGAGDSEENVIPDLCDGHYDAVAQLRGELFAFKGQYLWRFRQRGEVMQGYPVPLRRMFRDLPEQVTRMDAVYQREDGNIVLFSGHRYWVYNGVSFVENSPQSITRLGLPSSIDRIDAVMIWAKNKATYFFRGSDFWRYNTTTSRMDPGYPKRISKSWKQAPNEIDDAMTWTDGVSHFFKGDLSYQIDNAHVTVARTYRTAQIWFGCR